MRKRLTLLVMALVMALMMSFAGGAFAAKTTTFEKGACVTKAGQGQGGGEIKEQHHGQCGSQGAEF